MDGYTKGKQIYNLFRVIEVGGEYGPYNSFVIGIFALRSERKGIVCFLRNAKNRIVFLVAAPVAAANSRRAAY